MTVTRSRTPHFPLQALMGLFIALAACTFTACSNSELVDEFGVPVSDYAFEEGSQDTAYIKDTFTDFPPSGFYPNPFTILFPDNKPLNCEIGGYVPTKDSPLKTEIKIDSTSTVRCINFSDGSNTETTRTYIFEKKPTIPTIFITTDPNSLFNPDSGIYMKGPKSNFDANYWLDKEIPIFIELTETDSYIPAFSKYAGLKIFGNYSRMNAKKSVAITFREKYGDKRLNYELFPEFPNLNRFKGFILRNFGNSFGADYIRDRLASSISEGLDVDYQRGRYVIVYYNGKYFGIHDMRERTNEYYFETHYGMKHKNINILKTSVASNSTSSGSTDDYTALMEWLKNHNLSKEENYEYLASKIDINNTINYIQIETFGYNRDWPGNNVKRWSCTAPQTPWKWILYDLDLTFGQTRDDFPENVFEYAFSEKGNYWTNAPQFTFLFRSLLNNKTFKAAFINQMAALLQMNFESSKVLSQIEKMMAEIKEEIPRDQKRWSLNSSKMDEHLEKIKRFAQDRPSLITKHLQEFFKLGETVPIILSTHGNGTILVHNLPLDQGTLTITFFKDYPVTISAKPSNGGKWSHWNDGDTVSTRIIHPGKDKELTAFFK